MNETLQDYVQGSTDKVNIRASIFIKHEELRKLLDILRNERELSSFLSLVLNDLVSGKLVRVSDLINNGFIIIPITDKAKVSSTNSYLQEIYEHNETVKSFAYNMVTILQLMTNLFNNLSAYGMIGALQNGLFGLANAAAHQPTTTDQKISTTPEQRAAANQNSPTTPDQRAAADQNSPATPDQRAAADQNSPATPEQADFADSDFLELQETLRLTEDLMPDF